MSRSSSSRTACIGSSDATTATTASLERTPRSCSSVLISKLMKTGMKNTNKGVYIENEVEESGSSITEAESPFEAGRPGEVCEVSPVSCPPTPSNYTPVCEHLVLDSASSHFKKTIPSPRQNKSLANKQHNHSDSEDIYRNISTQESVQEVDTVMGVNSGSTSVRKRGVGKRKLPSPPPRDESLTWLPEQRSNASFIELLEKKRKDINAPSGTRRESSGVSMDCPNLVSIKCSSPHDFQPSQCPVSPAQSLAAIEPQSSSQLDRFRKEAGMFCTFDEDEGESKNRELTHRSSNDVFNILLHQHCGLFENSSSNGMKLGNFYPRLKLKLKNDESYPPKNRLLLSVREIHVSLEEGIVSTDSKLFLDNDKTSEKLSFRGKTAFQIPDKSTQKVPEMSRYDPTVNEPRVSSLSSASRRSSTIKAVLHREKTLLPFCGCLGSLKSDSHFCAM
eukprot:g2321.t1